MNTHTAILGLGASGVAATRLALTKGESVYVSDLRQDASTRTYARELRELGADVELGHHDLARIKAAHTVVVSPGIPPGAPVLRALRDAGIRWISEPEFAVRFLPGSLIAVTGTNGKTTTTLWIAHLLRAGGLDAEAGGNVGGGLAPAASELALRAVPPAWVVLEMSSFQLADIEHFAPNIGVVTTFSVDHQDRYPDLASYAADKARMFENARPGDRWVLHGAQPSVLALAGSAPGTRYLFAMDAEQGPAAHLAGGFLTLVLEGEGAIPLIPAHDLPVPGAHNLLNALAAALVAALAGVPAEAIRDGLRTLPALPHRMASVGEYGGVRWINDSKATNVEAAGMALASLAGPVVVLLGGKDKGEDFSPLAQWFPGRVRRAILFGEAGDRLEDVLSAAVEAVEVPAESMDPIEASGQARPFPVLERVQGDMDAVVAAAARVAEPGDVVLLAPACSSFDAFANYEARGRAFAEAVARRGRGGHG
jgi:UDP-N-acetylmuramoylalanine--D-glutamate ligase